MPTAGAASGRSGSLCGSLGGRGGTLRGRGGSLGSLGGGNCLRPPTPQASRHSAAPQGRSGMFGVPTVSPQSASATSATPLSSSRSVVAPGRSAMLGTPMMSATPMSSSQSGATPARAAMPATPMSSQPTFGGPSLRRFEFVAACEALLADSPGCACTSDLHELFDVLDPGCTGAVNVREFSRILQRHREEQCFEQDSERLWEELRATGTPLATSPLASPSVASGEAVARKNPLTGIRAWMLQHGWLVQDLVDVLGGPTLRLTQNDLEVRLLSRIRPPWLTPQGCADIFTQLRVSGETATSEIVRIEDFVEALLAEAPFAAELSQRCLRVVFREAHHRRPRVDVSRLCLASDVRRTGLLDLQQVANILDGICPGMLADADIRLLYRRFAQGKPGFSYDEFLAALQAERNDLSEHLLVRALPELRDLAEAFERLAREADTTSCGELSAAQLTRVLAKLGLGLCEEGLKELDDFAEVLALATGQTPGADFNYKALVNAGTWTGPSLEAAVQIVCSTSFRTRGQNGRGAVEGGGGGDDDGDLYSLGSRGYLLAILFYKMSQACSAANLGLSTQRAFERLDRGSNGFLCAEDLRLAVQDVLGTDETLADLGLSASLRMFFPEFEQRMDFDTRPLVQGLTRVFPDGVAAVSKSEFCRRLAQLGVDKATASTWVRLMCPAGVPAAGVERRCCDIFLATHTNATPAVASAENSRVAAARRQLCRTSGSQLRRSLVERLPIAVAAQHCDDEPLSCWLSTDDVNGLLEQAQVQKEDAAELVAAVAKASSYYRVDHVAKCNSEPAQIRGETLLSCAEPYQEHQLEVRLVGVDNLDLSHSKGGGALVEMTLGYHFHASPHVAETAGIAIGSVANIELDLSARHSFNLTSRDTLTALFEGAQDALKLEAWIAEPGGARYLAAAGGVQGTELCSFLAAAAAAKGSPAAILGARKTWRVGLAALPASAGPPPPPLGKRTFAPSVIVDILYARRTPADQQMSPLPWHSVFFGRSLLCRRAVGSTKDGAANLTHKMDEKPKPKDPPPGSVEVGLQLGRLTLEAATVRQLVARCLAGAAVGDFGVALAGVGLSFFVRFKMLPGRPADQGGGWSQTPNKEVPEALLMPDIGRHTEAMDFDFDFSTSAPLLGASEAVEELKNNATELELWLRVTSKNIQEKSSPSDKLAAEVLLAESSLQLATLLRVASPWKPEELCLRTLRPASDKQDVAFKGRDGALVASLVTALSLRLPGGPATVTWFLQDPLTSVQSEKPRTAKYAVRLLEVLLCKEFVEASAGSGGARFFFAELGKAGGSSEYRSEPVEGVADEWGIVRTAFPAETRFVLLNVPLLGSGKSALDTEIRNGKHHGVRVGIVQISSGNGARCVVEATIRLPVGGEDGLPSAFFAGRMWLPLYHTAIDTSVSIVGRALIAVEADPSEGNDRALVPVPAMPSGIWLPLHSTWQAQPGAWAMAPLVEAAVGDHVMWSRLTAAEKQAWPGVARAGDFEASFVAGAAAADGTGANVGASAVAAEGSRWSRGGGAASSLPGELAFLHSAVPAFFARPDRFVPVMQVLAWVALRRLARAVLPCAGALLHRLVEIDRRGKAAVANPSRGTRPAVSSGTVPVVALQEALREELVRSRLSPLPAALWEFLTRRPQWFVSGASFYGSENFDYLTFFADLQAAGEDVSKATSFSVEPCLAAGPGVRVPQVSKNANRFAATVSGDVASADQVACDRAQITIFGALQLPLPADSHGAVSAYVMLRWGAVRAHDRTNDLASHDSMEDSDRDCLVSNKPRAFVTTDSGGEEIGTIRLAQCTSDPSRAGLGRCKWNQSLEVPLPRPPPDRDGAPRTYPAAFRDVILELHVRVVVEGSHGDKEETALGVATVGLDPLRGRLFQEIDGYFYIEPAVGGTCGQIRARIVPRLVSESPLAEANRTDQQSVANMAGSLQTSWEPVSSQRCCPVGPRVASSSTAVGSTAEVALFAAPYDELPSLADLARGGGASKGSIVAEEEKVSELSVRLASRMSDNELQLCSFAGSEEEQLAQIRAKHRENLAMLESWQHSRFPAIGELSGSCGGQASPQVFPGGSGPLPVPLPRGGFVAAPGQVAPATPALPIGSGAGAASALTRLSMREASRLTSQRPVPLATPIGGVSLDSVGASESAVLAAAAFREDRELDAFARAKVAAAKAAASAVQAASDDRVLGSIMESPGESPPRYSQSAPAISAAAAAVATPAGVGSMELTGREREALLRAIGQGVAEQAVL
eukprot:TRINITY_DN18236_c0_g1_i1.p1 TRINITY_DN18236_c0_g1~~TRINITY_DN18236_c0_g1_i1.p1  ORF type:complete len:2246 (+),score=402.08 TRINITY_DN18236_c0_g1_i1:1-6738(+)